MALLQKLWNVMHTGRWDFFEFKKDAYKIIDAAINSALPDTAVKKALQELEMPKGRLLLVSIGKAGWSMAKAASDVLGSRIDDGIVITKYDHSQEICPISASMKQAILYRMKIPLLLLRKPYSLFQTFHQKILYCF